MVLHMAQKEFGHVGPEIQAYVAERLGVPVASVYGVVSFYTMYRQKPIGRNHVEICTNLSCQLLGADGLVECVKKRYGIKVGETSADGSVTLGEVECLAACGNAPALQINGIFHHDVTPEQLNRLLDGLK